MHFDFKKKYWWINSVWNKGNYTYWWKNWKVKKLFKNNKDRTLNIAKVIKIFNSNLNLFQTIKYFNIVRKPRNVFTNISTLNGKVLKSASCGMFFKRGSERRTFVAFNELLDQSSPSKFKNLKKDRFIVRVRTNNHFRSGFKRSIKMFIKSSNTRIYKHIGIKFKAHNGVRKKKQKRK